jgi:hypothetical protein
VQLLLLDHGERALPPGLERQRRPRPKRHYRLPVHTHVMIHVWGQGHHLSRLLTLAHLEAGVGGYSGLPSHAYSMEEPDEG